MAQVRVPVKKIQQRKCHWEDNTGNFVDFRDRIQCFFGVVHSSGDAALAHTFIAFFIHFTGMIKKIIYIVYFSLN